MNSREVQGGMSSASERTSSCVIPIVLLGRTVVVAAHGASDRRVSAEGEINAGIEEGRKTSSYRS
jgi:hypothetical protein